MDKKKQVLTPRSALKGKAKKGTEASEALVEQASKALVQEVDKAVDEEVDEQVGKEDQAEANTEASTAVVEEIGKQ